MGKNSSEKWIFPLLLLCKSLEHNRTNIFPLKLQVQPFDWIYIQTQLIVSKYVIVYKINRFKYTNLDTKCNTREHVDVKARKWLPFPLE